MEGMKNNPPLPPGFRFHPTDEELIIYYLRNKVSSSHTPIVSIIADIDLYKFNPWELPGKALFGESEWFFFSPRDRKYPNGARPNRAAASGYWKATGTDKPILAAGGTQCLGVKKALVFYKGRPPKGVKTDWVMNEYRLLDNTSATSQKLKGSMRLDDWVLCRVRQKSSMSLQVGEKREDSSHTSPLSFYGGNYQEKLPLRKRNDFFQETDYQLLGRLLGSHEEAIAGGGGGSKSISLTFQGTLQPQNSSLITSQGITMSMQPPFVAPPSYHQMLDSLKRSLSIGALDDISLLPPSKRLSGGRSGGDDVCADVMDEQSPSYSTNMSSYFPEFGA